MLYLIIFILILLVFFIIMLFLRAEVGIQYIRTGNDDIISISVQALKGIIRLKLDIPLSKFGEEKSKIRIPKKTELGKKNHIDKAESKDFDFKDIYDKSLKFYKLIKSEGSFAHEMKEYLSERVSFVGYNLEIEFGAGEAYYTAMIVGIIWAVYGLLESHLYNRYKKNQGDKYFNDIKVCANFKRKSLFIDLYCIFNTKVANIINISFKILKYYVKSKHRIKKMLGVDVYG